MLENIFVKEMYYDSDMWIKFFFNFQNFNNALTNIMWNSDTHAWLSGRQMLLGGTDAWFQSVATHLKFWLINRVFHFQGQGDGEWVGEGVKELHATVTCAVHKEQRGLCEETALPQLESTGLCPACSSLSLLAGSPTFISCTAWCHVSARAGAGGNGRGS